MIPLRHTVLSALISISPALAETPPSETGDRTLSKQTMVQIKRNPEQFIERSISQLFRLAPNGILTQAVLDAHQKMQIAQQRSNVFEQILRYDLDANLAVDAAEIETVMRFIDSNRKAALQSALVTSDSDHDGTLSFQEIVSYAVRKTAESQRTNARNQMLMEFDANSDGKVTTQEISAVVTGIIKHTEASPTAQTQQEQPSACAFPPPSKNADIILLGGYEGAAISTVAVSGLDSETTLAVLNIEKGESPLYIIATAYASIIWKIEGDTSRIEKFVAGVGGRGVGITGLDADTILFLPNKGCIPQYYNNENSGEALRAKGQVSARLGRSMIQVVGASTLGAIALPSGTYDESLVRKSNGVNIRITGASPRGKGRFLLTEDGPMLLEAAPDDAQGYEKALLSKFQRFYPGGVVTLNEKDVIASNKAQTYKVLPQQAGLLQLLNEGKLEITSDGFFKIIKPISHYPPGLNGAHSVRFILAKDIPKPAGSPGHSSVYLEETGECITSPLCL
ncbi:hypothetical protein MNBD_ALPHA07-2183 [hydrothermal vent metagenome]|uniref:EF-hand domain-containing protein n=1 Tax=hydrothermal vent metagenome TaxID=652676 RepID=A0A3B0R7T2_9ZZZZ